MNTHQAPRITTILISSLAPLAHAGPVPIVFHDSSWDLIGSSSFDPTPDLPGDTETDFGHGYTDIYPGELEFTDTASVSTYPISASISWELRIEEPSDDPNLWKMTIRFSKHSVSSNQPTAAGEANLELTIWQDIEFKINTIENDPTPLQVVELNPLDNVTITPLDDGHFDESTITPGRYTFVASADNTVSAGTSSNTIIDEDFVDYTLCIITSTPWSSDLNGPLVEFIDGELSAEGTSIYDPTPPGIVGDEITQNAFLPVSIPSGDIAFDGGGGTSSGPVSAGFEWSGQITQDPLNPNFWELSIEFEGYTSSAPQYTDGNANASLDNMLLAFRINDLNGNDGPVEIYSETDRYNNVWITPIDGNNDDGQLSPGTFRLNVGSLFVNTNSPSFQDSVDYTLRINACPVDLDNLTTYQTPGMAREVVVSADTAYIADGASGLQILDVTNPESPTPIGSYDTPGFTQDVLVDGSIAYIADGTDGGILLLDITNPALPQFISTYNTPGNAIALALQGNHLFVADNAGGLLIFDVSNSTNPLLIGTFPVPDAARSVRVIDDTAYLAAGNDGLYILDITDPTNPQQLGSYDSPGYAQYVELQGDVAYLADWTEGISVLDLTDPENIQFLGSRYARNAGGLVLRGSRLFLADGGYGIRVFDIRNPTDPIQIETAYDSGGFPLDIFLNNDTAYLALNDGGLQIFDVSDCETACPADLNGDGSADFFDVSALLTNTTDYNGDTTFDFFDISAFLQDLASGCP